VYFLLCTHFSVRAICWAGVYFVLGFIRQKNASHLLGCKHLIKAFQEHNTNVEQRGFFLLLFFLFVSVFTKHKAWFFNLMASSESKHDSFLGDFKTQHQRQCVCMCVRLSSRGGIVLLVLWKHAVTRQSSSEQPHRPPLCDWWG